MSSLGDAQGGVSGSNAHTLMPVPRPVGGRSDELGLVEENHTREIATIQQMFCCSVHLPFCCCFPCHRSFVVVAVVISPPLLILLSPFRNNKPPLIEQIEAVGRGCGSKQVRVHVRVHPAADKQTQPTHAFSRMRHTGPLQLHMHGKMTEREREGVRGDRERGPRSTCCDGLDI